MPFDTGRFIRVYGRIEGNKGLNLNNNLEARMKRGLELLEKGTKISENQDGSFAVPSLTSASVYEVRLIERVWVCTCPDFEYREVDCCKHVYAVRFWVVTNTYLQEKPKPKVFADDAMPCDKCGSIHVIKYGMSANKQVSNARIASTSLGSLHYSRKQSLHLSL